jgi:hypothetical protein
LQASEPAYSESPLAMFQVKRMNEKATAINERTKLPLFIQVHLLFFSDRNSL